MTFGVAQFNEENDSIEDLIKQADKTLYRGKEKGENRVVIANQNEYYEEVLHKDRKIFTSSIRLSGA